LDINLAQQDTFEQELFWQLRLPRSIAALAVGAIMALCGLTMQSLFRNPLAEPSLMGISGGAALGASLGFFCGLSLVGVQALAVFWALLALGIVTLFARQKSSSQLILAGVAINALCGSLLNLLLTQSNNDNLRTTTFWLMGNLGHLAMSQALFLCVLLAIIFCVLWPSGHFLNQLLLGEKNAFYAGFNVKRLFLLLLIGTASICALTVAQTGSIAFIALMAPHIARLIFGGNNRILLLGAPLIGATLTLLADSIAQHALYPIELPIGVVTSLLGVPFFLWLLHQERPHT
jgi:iron complex transport system permease protein